MTTNRRDFLKIAGASALTLIAPSILSPVWAKDNVIIPGNAALATKTSANALMAKRWAMAVDPSKCPTDCVDCIAACHTTHNVPDFGNPKDEVKWIWREDFPHIFPDENHSYLPKTARSMRPIVLCNHCANPPCVRVCPTKATFQRQDGIVMMDYHRCIGCRLCIAACPYGARSMNYRDPRPFNALLKPVITTRKNGGQGDASGLCRSL
jgi:molybdopterin-containing oxidoreductase family iron-sulfur binding subunit